MLGLAFYTPTLRRQIEILETRGVADPEFARLSTRGAILGGILGVIVIAIVALMGVQAVMKRRDFLSQTAVAATAFGLTASAGAQTPTAPAAHRFTLKYAPHIGMFENSAGPDPLDQIRFMADAGFRAFEDNGMMKRPIALQQQMGDLLAKRGLTMGVFVIDGGATTGRCRSRRANRSSCDVFVKGGAAMPQRSPGARTRNG